MATKFIQLDEAAKILGITPEKLNEMRERNEVRGFRDGATWKFKSDEVDRLSGTLQADVDSDEDELTLDLGEEPVGGDAGDSVLLSERELGGSDVMGSSTIIGDTESGDSDISLADDEGGTSDVELVGDSMIKDSDVKLAGSDVLGESSGAADAGSDLSLELDEADSLELQLDEGSSVDATAAKDDDLELTLAGDSDLSLGDDDLTLGEGEGGSGGSTIDLSEEDDDLVLGGTGSDVTIGASDSGISLTDPADSGLSLEEPLELGGSAIGDESLVLGEDDMISLGDDIADPSAATQLKSDDDFLLTPLEEATGDESESGSQVIALDEAGGFDQSAATMLAGGGEGMAMLEEDLTDADTMVGGPGMVPGAGAAAVAAGTPQLAPGAIMQPAVPEAPYSVWNVLSLFVCIILLSFTGMLMYDIVRQIWSWEGTYPVTSGLMDSLINTFMK